MGSRRYSQMETADGRRLKYADDHIRNPHFPQFFISDIITPPRLRRYSSYLKRRVVSGNIWVSGRKFRKIVHAENRRLKNADGRGKLTLSARKNISVNRRERKKYISRRCSQIENADDHIRNSHSSNSSFPTS
jgi:hypothetical protein